MPDHNKAMLNSKDEREPGSKITKWRWRPGMKPRNALNIGILCSAVGLLFVVIGLVSLIAGILDSTSPPLQVPGVVTGFTTNVFDNLPHVIMRIEKEGAASTISPAVTRETAQALHVGDHVILDYSKRLGFPFALEGRGQRYLLPGSSSSGNPFGSVALLLLGMLIFPYPAFLAIWGWRDLQSQAACTLTGKIVDLRSSRQQRALQPGITPRIFRSTYTLALEPVDSSTFQEVVTFVIKEEMYLSLREGAVVQITYSPYLHYVYALK